MQKVRGATENKISARWHKIQHGSDGYGKHNYFLHVFLWFPPRKQTAMTSISRTANLPREGHEKTVLPEGEFGCKMQISRKTWRALCPVLHHYCWHLNCRFYVMRLICGDSTRMPFRVVFAWLYFCCEKRELKQRNANVRQNMTGTNGPIICQEIDTPSPHLLFDLGVFCVFTFSCQILGLSDEWTRIRASTPAELSGFMVWVLSRKCKRSSCSITPQNEATQTNLLRTSLHAFCSEQFWVSTRLDPPPFGMKTLAPKSKTHAERSGVKTWVKWKYF